MRGRTTQNFASSTISAAADLAILAVTSTRPKSSVSRTAVTWPMFTSLYLTNVFPASMPSADLKMIVIVGPSLRMRWAAIPERHQRGQHRNDPDRREAGALLGHDSRLRQVVDHGFRRHDPPWATPRRPR